MPSSPAGARAVPILDEIFENAGVGLCLIAADGRIARVNAAWCRSTGLRVDVGTSGVQPVLGSREEALAMFARARAGERVAVPRWRRTANGRETWWEGSIAPVAVEGGTGLLVTVHEVREHAPHGPSSVALMPPGSLFDVVNDAVFVHDARTGAILDVNQRAEEMYGAPREEMRSLSIEELSEGRPPYTQAHALEHARAALAGAPQLFEWRARSRSGRLFWVEVNVKRVSVDGSDRLVAIVRDITTRKKREEALRQSEKKLRLLASAMPQIVCVLGQDGRAAYVNEAWVAYSGLDLHATRRAGWQGILHPDDVAVARECGGRALASLAPQDVELRYRRADGTFRWFLSRLAPIVEGGRVVRFVGAAMDIEDRKRAEHVLHDQLALKDQLAKVAASVPGVVCSFRLRPDGSACMPFSAPGIADLFGVPQEELARDMTPVFARTRAEDLRRVSGEIAESARTLSPWRSRFRYGHPTKGLRWMEGTSIPAREGDGGVLWHGYIADVTDQTRAEEAVRDGEAFLRKVIDAAPSLVFVKDRAGRFVLANEALARCYGAPVQEILGRTDADFNPAAEHVADFRRADLAVMDSRCPRHIAEERVRHADGEIRWYTTVKVPLVGEEGRCDQVLGIATDITDRKRAEQSLERADEALRRSEEALRDADRRKNEFLAMLAHELRNPLAAMSGAASVIRARCADHLQEIARPVEVLERQIRNSARLLDDLLDVSRVTRGVLHLHREPVHLAPVLHAALDSQRALIEACGHRVEISSPPEPVVVEGDATRLEQVISNLLNNAAKYTPRRGWIRVNVEEAGGEVVIRVSDNGKGIAPELLPHVFDLFVQAEQTVARTNGGLGLGLTLVRTIVQLHGGSIEARSAGAGAGSEFIVRLPAVAERACRVHAPEQGVVARRERRVLLVEDNLDTAELVAEFLRSLGHAVLVANDGLSAVDAARRFRPELVLLDIGLPGIDGYEVARRIRADPSLAGAVLVALTGYGQEEDRTRSREAGFAHHLTKPVEPAVIERLVACGGEGSSEGGFTALRSPDDAPAGRAVAR